MIKAGNRERENQTAEWVTGTGRMHCWATAPQAQRPAPTFTSPEALYSRSRGGDVGICYLNCNMKISIPFLIAINTLLVSGLVSYGNDTRMWDIPYRALASALADQGDLPIWYPNAGNGFPQLSLLWGSWTFPPLGILLGTLYPYNYFSFAIENLLWRLVGFAGSYLFARQWIAHPIGAVAIAAAYLGSGTAARGALSFSVFIGHMFAPWILAAGSLAIRASSGPTLATATGTLGLVAGLMVWSAYPGVWLTAPVLSGPLLLALAVTHRGGVRRLLIAATGAFTIAAALISLILSESTSVALVEGSLLSFRRATDMREGLLRGIDLLGVFFVNPSYLPDNSSAAMHPIYSGIVPIIVLASLFGTFRPRGLWGAPLLSGSLALALANTQNWSSWGHPLFRELPAVNAIAAVVPLPLIAVALAIALSGAVWGSSLALARVDTAMLAGIVWVLLVATDNPFANTLRVYVPPFALVRYNHFYFWLVTLLVATLAWRRIEQVTSSTSLGDLVPPSVRAWGYRVAVIGAACLAVVSVTAMATPDAYGLGAPADGLSAMGSPHLAWQATILAVCVGVGYLAHRGSSSVGALATHRAWSTSTLSSVIAFTVACATAFALRRAGITPPTVPISFGWQLVLDLTHGGLIIAAFVVAFAKASTPSALRVAIASIMVFDVALAVPRYFSDNDIVGASQPGWPWPPFEHGQSGSRFQPSGLGDRKASFAPPFEGFGAGKKIYGSFNPPPPVTRLREDWGTLYEQWVHFPAQWDIGPGVDVDVQRDSLADARSAPDCVPQHVGQHTAPSGRVTRLLATTVDVTFTADCDRLLVFTDSWAPGWSATIDGAPVPVLRVNNAIRAVMAPAGEHSLVWHYRPRFLGPLLALFALGLGTSFVLIATPWWSRWVPRRPSSRIDRLFGFGPVGGPSPSLDHLQLSVPASVDHPQLPRPPVVVAPTPATPGWSLPTWGIAIAVTAIGIATIASLALYDANIDGPSGPFRRFLVRSIIAGAWAWIVVAGRVGVASPIGPAILTVVLLPPLVLQVARHADPITRGAPVHAVASDFRSASWDRSWEVVGRGDAPDSGPGYITLRTNGPTARAITHAVPPPSPTLWAWWQRPLGANAVAPSYLVTWNATIERAGPYYTVLKLGRLTIQALKAGILVTAPAPGGDVTGDFIAGASPDGAPIAWQIISDPTSSTLSLDGQRVWTGGSAGTVPSLIFGDASADTEHRGVMSIASASVAMHLSMNGSEN